MLSNAMSAPTVSMFKKKKNEALLPEPGAFEAHQA